MRSQVTTRRGDRGFTVALNGHEYPKHHPIMECVGTLDELRTHLAMALLMIADSEARTTFVLRETLTWLLHVLFAVGAQCSDPLMEKPQFHRVHIGENHLKRLEEAQQQLEEVVRLPRQFVVGATNLPACQLDVACAVARRFERALVDLKTQIPDFQADDLLAFINRLSDFLYMAARYLDNGVFHTVNYDVV